MAKLGDICTIQSGGTPSRSNKVYWDNGTIPWVKISDFSGKYLDHTSEKITQAGLDGSSAKIFPKGTILYTIFATLGETCILDIDATTNQAIAGLKLNDDSVSLDYLYYYLLSKKEYVNEIGRGVAQNNINIKILREMEITTPSRDEQGKITDALNKVYELIALRKEQLAALDQLVKSRFIELFGDPDENPMKWETAELDQHLDVIGGFAFKSDGFTDAGIPVLRIGNINSGHFLPVNMVFWPDDPALARYKMYPGDLVMSLTGTVGKDDYGNVCILGDEYSEYYLNQRNAKLAINATLNKHYLSEMLKFSKIKKRLTGISRGVRQANISNRDILALCVPIPPIGLQEQFAAFVEQTGKSKLAIQRSLDKLETLKKALMQKYFG